MKITFQELFRERERCQEQHPATKLQCVHWEGHGGCCTARQGEVTHRWIVPGRVETWQDKPIFRK